jgi:hypothetical protein
MPPSVFTLDSRNRTNDDYPNNCQFLLQNTLIASKFELTNFQFANTLYNVTSRNNKLYVSGILAATMTAKFWLAADFVIALNTQLKAYFVTAADVVTLDASTNILTWVLPSGSLTSSTMNRILGLVGTPSGNFTSTLFLVGPTQLALLSDQFNCFSYNSFASTNRVCGIIPVTQGFMQMQFYEPSKDWIVKFEPFISFNNLGIRFVDNCTGYPAEGMGEWCATFIVS